MSASCSLPGGRGSDSVLSGWLSAVSSPYRSIGRCGRCWLFRLMGFSAPCNSPGGRG